LILVTEVMSGLLTLRDAVHAVKNKISNGENRYILMKGISTKLGIS
jgi:hypothetical protein